MAGVVLSTLPEYPTEERQSFQLGECVAMPFRLHFLDNKVGTD